MFSMGVRSIDDLTSRHLQERSRKDLTFIKENHIGWEEAYAR